MNRINILQLLKKQLKGIIAASLLAVTTVSTIAQNTMEGTTYYLPQTAINVTLLIEKTSIIPGELHQYAERFLKKKNVPSESSTTYRIVDMKLNAIGVPDTAKQFTANVDAKHTINQVELSTSGIILAINAEPKPQPRIEPFTPAPKPKRLNAHDYMNQDILSAGSTAKMAELTAQEIYDIRESKSLLNKGQADFMPKDGEQLRIMIDGLNTQEKALLQVFEGITTCDTTEVVITYTPQKESREVLFRFSKKLGLLESDDLAGSPYYIQTTDLHMIPTNQSVAEGKVSKDDANIFINLPGRIKVDIQNGNDIVASEEFFAGQFGKAERLDNELFGKKLFTTLIYNPVTGNLESQQTEMVKK